MLAVTELCGKLGLTEALDEAMGPVKQRRRGFTGGQVLTGMAAAQLAGEDFLVGLDRLRADEAGQQVTPVPGLAASTATGLARRFTPVHWRGAEAGLAQATARMVGMLPAERAAELAEGPVTIDIDATGVEVYGNKKRGVAYTYQGQRAGLPHVAAWAETEIPLAADLLAGDQDPRSSVVALLGRALAALPQAVRDGAAAGRKIALRADAGYFAGDLARAAAKADMAFAIGAKRITSMWKALAGIGEDAWRDATGMENAQVAVSPYRPAEWPGGTVLLIRRVRLDPEQVSADPRSRRRRTLHPDQRALPIPELEAEPAIYAYSFILTNLDVSTPARAAACEHWYRHRTAVENIFRDSKHGAALRHLPSGYEQASTAWMWASLIAAAVAAWLHQLTGLISGRRTAGRARHPRRQGDDRHPAADTDRHPRAPGQPRRAADHAPGPRRAPAARHPHHDPRPASPRLAAASITPRSPSRHRHPDPRPRPQAPHQQKGPDREPGASPGPSSCPPARPDNSKIIYRAADNVRRPTRGFGSEDGRTAIGAASMIVVTSLRSRTGPAGSRAGSRGRRRGGPPCRLPGLLGVMGKEAADHFLVSGSQVDLRRGELGMTQDKLDIGDRQLRVLGHPVGGRVTQRVQGRPAPGRLPGPLEHPVHRVISQRPRRAAQRPPQRLPPPLRDQPLHLQLVKPQPHERVSGGRQLLQFPAALPGHRDQLPPRVRPALGDRQQLRRPGTRGHVERHQRPVPVRRQPGEDLVELLIRDAARNPRVHHGGGLGGERAAFGVGDLRDLRAPRAGRERDERATRFRIRASITLGISRAPARSRSSIAAARTCRASRRASSAARRVRHSHFAWWPGSAR